VLAQADVIVVAVPTPIVGANRPDLRPLKDASEAIGRHMTRGATVVFESTVYPGATEEICVPALERSSGLTWREGFHVGYSPERINPGDPVRNLGNVKKIVAGDSPATADRLCALYGSIVGAGIYRAPSIKVAEAAKGDARNSRVVELVAELRELGVSVAIHDPLANPDWVRHEYGLELTPFDALPRADCVVMAVPHDTYLERPLADLAVSLKPGGLIVDVKSRLPRDEITAGGYRYWRI